MTSEAVDDSVAQSFLILFDMVVCCRLVVGKQFGEKPLATFESGSQGGTPTSSTNVTDASINISFKDGPP